MGFLSSIKKTWKSVRTWTWHHAAVFIMTFLSYAFFHACRKSFSNIKNTWDKSFSPQNNTCPMFPKDVWQKEQLFGTVKDANVFLGELDSLFLIAYAIGLFFSGMIGDRVNLRYMLSFGMCSSAILTFLFGYISEVIHMENLFYYRCIYFLNGLCQSTGWPASVAIMGNWFSKSSGGLVFGFWSGNASFGNIIGSLVVSAVLSYGYEYGMLLNSVLLFCGGVIMFFCLIVHPQDVGLDGPDHKDNTVEVISQSEDHVVKPAKAIGFFEAFLLPGVLPYALSYACLKLVNYAFFFWLPTYLTQGLGWSDKLSDELSNFYDLGGIFGGILAGIVTDLMGIRSPMVSLMLFLSMGSMYLYASIGSTKTINTLVMVLTGFLLGGPANTISTAITADLGKHEKIKGSAEALATVTGIIDGTGSAGAAIGQYIVGVIDKHLGWHYVFYFLIVMTGLSLICIIPMNIKDLKNFQDRRRAQNYQRIPANEVD